MITTPPYASLDSDPERRLFRASAQRYAGVGRRAPALIPQVYLHYDPCTRRELAVTEGDELPRQRMDFLLLLPGRVRIVIEVDGRRHYADGEKASPRLYSEMVAEDRNIRLAGYEVFRFGGYERARRDADAVLKTFLDGLLEHFDPGERGATAPS